MKPTAPDPQPTLEQYLATIPDDVDAACAAVAPYRDMTPAERWACLDELMRAMAKIHGDRPPIHDDDYEPLWPRWKDPLLGRPS